MGQKGGDSTRCFQRTFFHKPVQQNPAPALRQAEKNRSSFWLKPNSLVITPPASEILALQVAVLMSRFS